MAVEMKKIEFKDNQEPAISADNLNQMQRNIEEAIGEGGGGDGILTGSVIGYTGEEIPDGYEEVSGGSFGSGMPVGSGCDFFGNLAPVGFMFADGSAISRTEYAELFAIIGTIYGDGDGITTFNLPDKRERVSAMYKEGSTNFGTLGKKVGADTHTLSASEMPSHNHKVQANVIQWKDGGKYQVNGQAGLTPVDINNNITTTSTGSGLAHNNIQQTLVCNYIIKVK